MNATIGLFKLSYFFSCWSALLPPVSYYFQAVTDVWGLLVRKNQTRSEVYPFFKLLYLPTLTAVIKWDDPAHLLPPVVLVHLQCFVLRERLWIQNWPRALLKTLHRATLHSNMSSKPTSLCLQQEFGYRNDTTRWNLSQNCGGILNGSFSRVLKTFTSNFPVFYDNCKKHLLEEGLFGKH